MTITANSPLVFQYLNLLPYGARGGVTRFFLLAHQVPFEEQLISMGDDWAAEKKRLIETGENPSGSLPILRSKDDTNQPHPQHIAVTRYLARVYNLTSGDDYKDYVQDLVADEYQGFRDQWVKVTFTGSEEEKAEYKKDTLVNQLTKFNALYKAFMTDQTFLSVSAKTGQPLWGDAAVYGLLRDHILTGYMTLDDLAAPYPHLFAMYQAFEAIPEIQKWLEGLNKK